MNISRCKFALSIDVNIVGTWSPICLWEQTLNSWNKILLDENHDHFLIFRRRKPYLYSNFFSIWNCCLDLNIKILDFEAYGWKLNVKENMLEPVWMTTEQASLSCQELMSCKCKKSCSGRCKCKKSGLACTQLCACGGGCYQEA